MFRTIDDFDRTWTYESGGTIRILQTLTDSVLNQAAGPQERTLARMAWHIVTTIPEMMRRTGLEVTGPSETAPVPSSSSEITGAYETTARALLEAIKASWNDETLQQVDDMYGEPWPRGQTLAALVHHQIHHRAQMTVLMREAGLSVPGIYGPAREEWKRHGMEPPPV